MESRPHSYDAGQIIKPLRTVAWPTKVVKHPTDHKYTTAENDAVYHLVNGLSICEVKSPVFDDGLNKSSCLVIIEWMHRRQQTAQSEGRCSDSKLKWLPVHEMEDIYAHRVGVLHVNGNGGPEGTGPVH